MIYRQTYNNLDIKSSSGYKASIMPTCILFNELFLYIMYMCIWIYIMYMKAFIYLILTDVCYSDAAKQRTRLSCLESIVEEPMYDENSEIVDVVRLKDAIETWTWTPHVLFMVRHTSSDILGHA